MECMRSRKISQWYVLLIVYTSESMIQAQHEYWKRCSKMEMAKQKKSYRKEL